MTRTTSILLGLFGSLLAAQPQLGYAEPARVEGGVTCRDSFGDGTDFCDFSIELDGEITPSTVGEVKAVFAENAGWREDPKVLATGGLRINSNGGDVSAAMAIGRILRDENMPMIVERDAVCVSSCVLILAGAVDRLAIGRVGIHRPYISSPTDDLTERDIRSAYAEMLDELRAYMREMNVSERLAENMLRIEPEKVRYLGRGDLEAYGLSSRDPVYQETLDVKEARELGLARQEYIQRKALSERVCPPTSAIQAWRECYDRIMGAR